MQAQNGTHCTGREGKNTDIGRQSAFRQNGRRPSTSRAKAEQNRQKQVVNNSQKAYKSNKDNSYKRAEAKDIARMYRKQDATTVKRRTTARTTARRARKT